MKKNGFILIPVLLVLAVAITLVADFSYETFVDISSMKNYVISERLSLLANSCLDLTLEYINAYLKGLSYTTKRDYLLDLNSYLQSGLIPESGGSTTMSGEITAPRLQALLTDENSKFNLNSLYTHIPSEKLKALSGLKRLLKKLGINEEIALRISDWIDRDSDEEIPGAERVAKNNRLYSVEELLQIPGIDEETYEKLKPYVTCYTDGRININSAPAEVLITLDGISDTIAEAIVDYRNNKPFENTSELKNVPGISTSLFQGLQGRYTVKAMDYSITIIAEESGIKRYVHGVVNTDALRLKYFREE